MLMLSLYGSIALAFALHALVDRRGVAISAAALALGVATLSLAGVHMVRVIDQPTTPTASLGMRIYLFAFTVGTGSIAVVVARDVFLSVQPAALSVLGLVGAVLTFNVGFVVLCAWIVQVGRANRAKASSTSSGEEHSGD
jgi:hypothetical protein